VVGYVHLVGAPDAAEVAAPVARGVDEDGAAASPAAGPQSGSVSVVDHVRQPGRDGDRDRPRLLYLFPVIGAAVGNAHLALHLEQVGPMTAGLAIQATTGLRGLRIGPWAGLGVLGAWAAAALLAGELVPRLRDA
jgi:hypothetical protein